MKLFLKHAALTASLACATWGVQAQTVTLKVHHFLGCLLYTSPSPRD